MCGEGIYTYMRWTWALVTWAFHGPWTSYLREGESFWEGGDDFEVEVLRFHTCLTDILGFLEKLEWWFEQDIDKEEERFEGDEDGGEV
ncbi:hypothetical protein Tco_1338761 [Tanacetum coccineum]